jgi:hypothetical protein
MRVERVQVLLAGAIEPLGIRVDPLLYGGVWNLFYEATDLQVEPPWAGAVGRFEPGKVLAVTQRPGIITGPNTRLTD